MVVPVEWQYTVSQKTTQLWISIAWNYVHRFSWRQRYSKVSRIEFACFSFHARLLVITLSSLKLYTDNSTYMLCASVSCWARLLLQHLRRRSLWIIHETDDRWIPSPPHENFLWLFGGSAVCLPDLATATQLCRRYTRSASAAAQMPGYCSELHQQLLACWCCSSSNLCSELFVINCRALQPLHSYRFLIKISSPLLNSVKAAAFA